MNTNVSPNSSLRSSSRLRICAWTETSRADTGSSHTIDIGVEDEAPGDGDALALSPRELARPTLAVAVSGSSPTASRVRATLTRRSTIGASSLLFHTSRGSPTILADALDRIERRHRVLEDHLELTSLLAQLLVVERSQVDPVEGDRARSRLRELEQRPPECGLATPRFADETERLAAAHVDTDAAHGMNLGATASDREFDGDLLGAQQRIGTEMARSRARHQSTLPASSNAAPPLPDADSRRRGPSTGCQQR